MLLGVPSAVAAVGARWLTAAYIVDKVPAAWHEMILMWLNGLILSVFYVAMTFAAVRYLRGQAPTVRGLLGSPWRRLPLVFGVGVVLTFLTWWPEPLLAWSYEGDQGIILDYAILVTNVLAIDVLTFVVLPVLLVEDWPIVPALRRSLRLATRHPWRLLAIDIGFWGVYFLYSGAMGLVYSWPDPEWVDFVWNALIALWTVCNVSAGCCLTAVAYHLIRNEQEGPAPETLARVFD